MKLRKDDYLVMMEVLDKEEPGNILTVCRNGFGKRTPLDDYRVQTRGGMGIINIRVTARNGPAVGVNQVRDTDEVMIVTQFGKIIRSKLDGVSLVGRATQGVRLIQLDEGDSVVSVANLTESEEQVDKAGAAGSGNGATEGEAPAGEKGEVAEADES
jgi:DNA gyrase subunit A